MPRETPNDDRNAHGRFSPGNKVGPRLSGMPDTEAGRAAKFKRGSPKTLAAAKKGGLIASKMQALRKALEEAVTEIDVTEMTKAVINKAKEGDVFAFREVLDRTIGKATQSMDITSDGKPIKGFVGVDVDEV